MKPMPGVGLAALAAIATLALAPDTRAQEGPTGAQPAGQSLPQGTGEARVHVTSDTPHVVLARFDFLGAGPRQGFYSVSRVCTAPCVASVPLGDWSFRAVGPRIAPSPTFFIPEGATDVDVSVRAGSWRSYVAGVVLTTLGAAYTPTGGGLLVAREATLSSSETRSLAPIGAVFLGAGVVGLAVGLPLWIGNRTHVDVRSRAAVAVGPGGLTF
jgi:hypothetical protein